MKLDIGKMITVEIGLEDRTIIPTLIPHNSIKALDITKCSNQQRNLLEQRIQEYIRYINNSTSNLFNFEDWMQQVAPDLSINNVNWIEITSDDISN